MELKEETFVWLLMSDDEATATHWRMHGVEPYSLLFVDRIDCNGDALLRNAEGQEVICSKKEQGDFLQEVKVGDKIDYRGEPGILKQASVKRASVGVYTKIIAELAQDGTREIPWTGVKLVRSALEKVWPQKEKPCEAFCKSCGRLAISGQQFCFACLR